MIDFCRTSSHLRYRTDDPSSFVPRELCVRFSKRIKMDGKTQKLRRGGVENIRQNQMLKTLGKKSGRQTPPPVK